MKFTTIAVCAGLSASLASATSAETLIASSSVPPSHFLNTEGMVPLMECIKTKSNGDIDFNFFPSGQIASTVDALDALSNNLGQLVLLATSAMSNKLPLNQITMLADMGSDVPTILAAYRKEISGGMLMAKELEANHIVPLTVIYATPYQLGLAGPRIEKIEDFEGKKVRVSGGGQTFGIKTIGGIPVTIQSADAYVAMQQGTVDGYLLSITSISPYSLQEVTKSLSTNGNFANAQTLLAMDDRVFDKFSPEQQKLILDCGLEVEASAADFVTKEAARLAKEFAGKGVDVYQFSDELWAQIAEKMQPATQDYIDRLKAQNLPGDQALQEYRQALGK